jgi:hypothetical protein
MSAREMARKAKWYHIVTEKMRVNTISRVRAAMLVSMTPGADAVSVPLLSPQNDKRYKGYRVKQSRGTVIVLTAPLDRITVPV